MSSTETKGRYLLFRHLVPYQERERDNCQWLVMTGDDEWLPYDESFTEQEDICVNMTQPIDPRDCYLNELTTCEVSDISTSIYRVCSSIAFTGYRLLQTDELIANTLNCSPLTANRT